jgi:hypothetical protein
MKRCLLYLAFCLVNFVVPWTDAHCMSRQGRFAEVRPIGITGGVLIPNASHNDHSCVMALHEINCLLTRACFINRFGLRVVTYA